MSMFCSWMAALCLWLADVEFKLLFSSSAEGQTFGWAIFHSFIMYQAGHVA